MIDSNTVYLPRMIYGSYLKTLNIETENILMSDKLLLCSELFCSLLLCLLALTYPNIPFMVALQRVSHSNKFSSLEENVTLNSNLL